MPFIAAKSVMFVRNTPARTTSSKLLLVAFRTADRFWKTRSVSGTMPPSTTLPVAGSWATCPLKKKNPSIWIAWENGPTGGASSGEVIAVLLIASSFGYWVRWSGWWSPRLRALPMPCGRGPFPHHSTRPCPRNSRFPQRHNWIHLGRSPSRNVASGNRNDEQKQRHHQKYGRIIWANAIEQTCHHRSGRSGKYHAGHNSEASQDYTFPQDKSQDIRSLGTQRQPQTNLA